MQLLDPTALFNDSYALAAWAYFSVIVAVAGFVRGLTGFGFSAICFFALSIIILPIHLVPLVFMLEIAASIHLLPKVWRQIPYRWTGCLILGSFVGTPIGVLMLSSWSADAIRTLVGVLVFCACMLLWRGVSASQLQGRFNKKYWVIFIVGSISGFFNGMAAVGGMVVAVFGLWNHLSPQQLRASLILFFVVLDMYGLSWLVGQGNVPTYIMTQALIALPFMLLGNYVGFRYFDKVTEQTKRKLSIGLLMLLSVIAIIV